MSTLEILVTVFAVATGALVVFLIGFATYQVIANDIARRLRADAERLPGGPLDPRMAGIRYAAETIEAWGKR